MYPLRWFQHPLIMMITHFIFLERQWIHNSFHNSEVWCMKLECPREQLISEGAGYNNDYIYWKNHIKIKQHLESQKSYYIFEKIKPGGSRANQAGTMIKNALDDKYFAWALEWVNCVVSSFFFLVDMILVGLLLG